MTIVSSRKDTDPVAHLDPTDVLGPPKTGTNSSLFNFSTDKDVLCSLGRAPSHLCSFTTASYAYLVLHPHLTTLSLCP